MSSFTRMIEPYAASFRATAWILLGTAALSGMGCVDQPELINNLIICATVVTEDEKPFNGQNQPADIYIQWMSGGFLHDGTARVKQLSSSGKGCAQGMGLFSAEKDDFDLIDSHITLSEDGREGPQISVNAHGWDKEHGTLTINVTFMLGAEMSKLDPGGVKRYILKQVLENHRVSAREIQHNHSKVKPDSAPAPGATTARPESQGPKAAI